MLIDIYVYSCLLQVVDSSALHQDLSEEEALAAYFQLGYTNAQICYVVEHCHGVILTLDQVKKRLVKLGLRRRQAGAEVLLADVEAAIQVFC